MTQTTDTRKRVPVQRRNKKRRFRDFNCMLRSSQFKGLAPLPKLFWMLRHLTFEELLEHGYLFSVEGARRRLGMTGWALRLACKEKRQDYIKLGKRYYFLPEQIEAAFSASESQG